MQFLKSIFDLSFAKFISTKVIPVIFIFGVVILVAMCAALSYYLQFEGAFICLILPTLIFIASVICWRVTLEMYVALIRIAENTTKLVEINEPKETDTEQSVIPTSVQPFIPDNHPHR